MAEVDEILTKAEGRMGKALEALHDNFTGVRTGRATPMVLDRIKVDYYGTPTPINQMAGVKTPDAHMLVIEPWDKSVLGAIESLLSAMVADGVVGDKHNSNTELIGKTIYMKTPITCTHPRRHEGYICSACYGKLMASLNCDIHIGKIAAAESADEIEQKLLSAKHALQTDTIRVEFDEIFYQYFELGNGQIGLNSDMAVSYTHLTLPTTSRV